MKKLGSDDHVVELPDDLNINWIFSVEDLSIYHHHHEDECAEIHDLKLPSIPKVQDHIEHQIVSTKEGGIPLVSCERNRSIFDCSWILEEDFIHIDLDLYEQYHISH